MPSGLLTFQVNVAPDDVRTVEVDPDVDLDPLTPDEFVMLMGFIQGVGAETDEDAELAAAGGAVLVHLCRALPDIDPVALARAVRDM